jgi:hypothetical protein
VRGDFVRHKQTTTRTYPDANSQRTNFKADGSFSVASPSENRNQLNSCLFVHLPLSARTLATSWVWRSGTKRHVGLAAFQGRAFEGTCDDDFVFGKYDKTRTSRWASGSSFTWAVAWSSST